MTRKMTDREKVEALVEGGLAEDEKEAVFMLIDMGDWEDDGTIKSQWSPDLMVD